MMNGDKTSPVKEGRREKACGMSVLRIGKVALEAMVEAVDVKSGLAMLRPPTSTTLRIPIITSIIQS